MMRLMNPADESNQVFLKAWEVIGSGAPDAGRHSLEGIELAWSGLPSPFFNLALSIAAPASLGDFSAKVKETVDWATPRNAPWILGLCQETLGELFVPAAEHLEQNGFAVMMTLTGMEAPAPQLPLINTTLEIATEADERAGYDSIRVNSAGYHVEIAPPGTLPMEQSGWWAPPNTFLTVMREGRRPLSSAAVLNLNGLPYVALVATHPDAQRRGLATIAMADVLRRAQAAGLSERAYLHATAAGRPVYERMGFVPTAEYTLFVKI